MSEHYTEAEEMLDEIEEDARDGEGLTIDQRISLAGIRAHLAGIEASRAQTAVMSDQVAMADRAADAMEVTSRALSTDIESTIAARLAPIEAALRAALAPSRPTVADERGEGS